MNNWLETLKLVSPNESILSIATSVTTIWSFIFGMPYLLNQHMINNLSINAEKALDLVFQIEKNIELFLKAKESEKSRCNIIPSMLTQFCNLQNILRFLPDKKVQYAKRWVANTILILNKNDHQEILSHIEDNATLGMLESFKTSLEKIQKAPVKWWHYVLVQLLIFILLTIY